MRKKLLVGVAAMAIIAGIGMASKTEAQPFITLGATGVFGNPNFPITFNETNSPGTKQHATIAAEYNRAVAIRPAAFPTLAANSVRLGQALFNAGFTPTSPARWPFAVQ